MYIIVDTAALLALPLLEKKQRVQAGKKESFSQKLKCRRKLKCMEDTRYMRTGFQKRMDILLSRFICKYNG